MTELRRTPRARLDAAIEIAFNGQTERHAARSRDISLGGMFLESDVLPEFGAQIVVTLTMPGEKAPFQIPGVAKLVEYHRVLPDIRERLVPQIAGDGGEIERDGHGGQDTGGVAGNARQRFRV